MQAPKEKISWDIDVRLRLVVAHVLPSRNDWKLMEAATGVAAEKWRQWERGTTRPSAVMIEAVCKAWPKYAFWLATGLSDPYFGHVSPFSARLGFPFATPEEYLPSRASTHEYFKASLEALQKRWDSLPLLPTKDNRQLAEELEDYDVRLAFDSLEADTDATTSVLIKGLETQFQQRLEDVITNLRERFPWVDKFIDYRRAYERDLLTKHEKR